MGIAEELRSRIEGEVRFDRYSRLLYSTDASIYQIEPIGVVIPRHAGDVQEVVRLAAREKIPVLPRGGGTSLAGQAVGEAIVMDLSKYMAGVLEVSPEESWARIQPGVVHDVLGAHLKKHRLRFGPETATSNRANLGGMIGNNSAGARSLVYGKTVDNVHESQSRSLGWDPRDVRTRGEEGTSPRRAGAIRSRPRSIGKRSISRERTGRKSRNAIPRFRAG